MKCELCHKAEAEKAIHVELKNSREELYVCGGCAAKVKGVNPVLSSDAAEIQEIAPEQDGNLPEMPLVNMLIDAAFEIVGRSLGSDEPTCAVCGIKRQEYRNQSRLGCPECYNSFARDLDPAIADMHGALQHEGKAPASRQAQWQSCKIEEQLAKAVKEQRYDDAIALRDALLKLHDEGIGEGNGNV